LEKQHLKGGQHQLKMLFH